MRELLVVLSAARRSSRSWRARASSTATAPRRSGRSCGAGCKAISDRCAPDAARSSGAGGSRGARALAALPREAAARRAPGAAPRAGGLAVHRGAASRRLVRDAAAPAPSSLASWLAARARARRRARGSSGAASPPACSLVARERRSSRAQRAAAGGARHDGPLAPRRPRAHRRRSEVVATEMPEPVSVEFAPRLRGAAARAPGRAGHRPDDGARARELATSRSSRCPRSSRRRPAATSPRSSAGSPRPSARGTGSTASSARSRRRGAPPALVLGSLPILMLLLLQVLNPAYMGRSSRIRSAHMILLFAVLSWLARRRVAVPPDEGRLLGGGVRFDPLAFGIASLAIGGLAGLAAARWRSRGAAARRWRTGSSSRRRADPFASTFAPLVQPPARRGPGSRGSSIRSPGSPAPRARRRRGSSSGSSRPGSGAPTPSRVHLAAKLGLALGLLATVPARERPAGRARRARLRGRRPGLRGRVLPAGPLARARGSARASSTLERGLPDALDLMVTCVEAGLGLDAAVQRVSRRDPAGLAPARVGAPDHLPRGEGRHPAHRGLPPARRRAPGSRT